jgi:Mrp family chromosome partitioning ATPase
MRDPRGRRWPTNVEALSSQVAPAEQGTLAPYVRAIRAHALLVAVVVAAAVGASVAWLATRTPVYEASAELLIRPVAEDDEALLALPLMRNAGDPTRTIQTAAALLKSHDAAARAARRLGGDWTGRRVSAAIEISPQGQTNIISIGASASGARLAADLANTYATSALAIRAETLRRAARDAVAETRAQLRRVARGTAAEAELQRRLTLLTTLQAGSDPTVAISERAVAPASATGSPPWIIVALALLGGLTLGVATALVQEAVRPETIRSEEELSAAFAAPVLARLPDLRRYRDGRSIRDEPLDPRLRNTLRSVHVQLDLTGNRSRTVMFASPTAYDGKTSVAVDFARSLQADGASVVLINADPRDSAVRAALDLAPPEEVPLAAVASGGSLERLDSVPGADSIWFADVGDAAQEDKGINWLRDRVAKLVEKGRATADYVVIDTPPLRHVSDTLTLLNLVDDVIVVVRLRATRRLDVDQSSDLLARAGVAPSGVIVVGAGRKGARR